MEGWLQKQSPKGVKGVKVWQKRYFLLKGDAQNPVLLYAKSKEDVHNPSSKRGSISLISARLVPTKDRATRIELMDPSGRLFKLEAETAELRERWRRALLHATSPSPNGAQSASPTVDFQRSAESRPSLRKSLQLSSKSIERGSITFTSSSEIGSSSGLVPAVTDPADFGGWLYHKQGVLGWKRRFFELHGTQLRQGKHEIQLRGMQVLPAYAMRAIGPPCALAHVLCLGCGRVV